MGTRTRLHNPLVPVVVGRQHESGCPSDRESSLVIGWGKDKGKSDAHIKSIDSSWKNWVRLP